jgi:hypothetical protein
MFTTPASIVSGRSYRVLEVAGHSPDDADDFVGSAAFTLDMDGSAYRVQGVGCRVEERVRYHEKDVAHGGKDIRVWQVSRHDDGAFYAEHAAAF